MFLSTLLLEDIASEIFLPPTASLSAAINLKIQGFLSSFIFNLIIC